MENDLISSYKKAYISDVPDIWGKIKTGIEPSHTVAREAVKARIRPTTTLTVGAKYPWMVLLAATIIVMIFTVPMSVFLVRHQTDYVFAAPYAKESNSGNSALLTVQIVDESIATSTIGSSNVTFTHKQLTAIYQGVFFGVIGVAFLTVFLISIIRVNKRRKSYINYIKN